MGRDSSCKAVCARSGVLAVSSERMEEAAEYGNGSPECSRRKSISRKLTGFAGGEEAPRVVFIWRVGSSAREEV